MDAEQTPITNRDRDLRRTRRLKAGMVSAGVVGSLGVAGVVGYAAANAAGHTSATGSQTSSRTADNGNSFVFPTQGQVSGDDGGQGDDGYGQLPQTQGQSGGQSNPFAGQPPPQLQQGFGGGPQAGTGGS